MVKHENNTESGGKRKWHEKNGCNVASEYMIDMEGKMIPGYDGRKREREPGKGKIYI